MSDNEILLMMVVFAIPAIGMVWGWRKLRSPNKRRENDEDTKVFLTRLQSPDFTSLEDHFGIALPSSLKDFYGSNLVIEGCDFKVSDRDWSIAFFESLDGDSLCESWAGCECFVSIANDECGNEYVFDPKTESKPVLFHDHETGGFDDVIPTLDEFLAAARDAINN